MNYPNIFIENLLEKFKLVIGTDFDKYRNHVYRVFLNCLILDAEKSNEEKYAIAAVFHDIGIWTDHTIDYITPSIKQAEIYLAESGQQQWKDQITLMINWHHKTSRYKGRCEAIVETFRKADWIDVSLGVLTFGVNKFNLKKIRKKFPNLGFHRFLARQIIKNTLRHPLNPLPMFKK